MGKKISINIFSAFFYLFSLEAASIFLYLGFLPSNSKNALLFGFTSSRLLILAGLLLIVVLSIYLGIASAKETRVKDGLGHIKGVLLKHVTLTTLICVGFFVISILYLLIPETGLRGQYPAIFERLDPLVLLIALFNMQVLLFLAYSKPASLLKEERPIYWKHLLGRYILPIVVFVFPFLFFFPRTIPINGEFYGVANDFIPTSYTYKAYLLDCLSQMHFPLWSPSESAGYPFFSNPFSQAFYPLNIPMTGLYILNQGYSILDNQRFAVLGISIFALGLYLWLREFRFSLRSVFITSMVIPVSYRLAELIRYPSGLHSVAWYPWIMLFLTKVVSARSIKSAIGYAFGLVFSCICLVTGGYQYYLFYSIFLIVPYIFLLLIPPLRKRFFPKSKHIKVMHYVTLGISAIILGVIAGPYVLRMGRLLSLTSSRGGGDFSFSTADNYSIVDALGSLVYPPASQTEGLYYFGMAVLVMILFFLLARPLLNKEKWATQDNGKTWSFWFLDPWVTGSLCFWYLLISYITLGEDSIVFIFLWKYFPFFSNLRFIGRMNVVLVPLVALLLAMSVDFFTLVLLNLKTVGSGRRKVVFRWFLAALLAIGIPACVQYYLIHYQRPDYYWSNYFTHFAGLETSYPRMVFVVFLLFSLTLFVYSLRKKSSHILFWIPFLLITWIDLWPLGAYFWWNGTMSVAEDSRRLFQISDRVFTESFSRKRDATYDSNAINLTSKYKVNYSNDWYYSNYREFYLAHDFEPEARKDLLGVTDAQRVFFSRSIDHKSIKEFLNDSRSLPFSYDLLEFNGDRLRLAIDAPEDGYVSYIDNWDPEWKAYVNEKNTPVEKLFSTFKTVKVEKGKSEVIFSYEPVYFSLNLMQNK
jgi:hypothetical protein